MIIRENLTKLLWNEKYYEHSSFVKCEWEKIVNLRLKLSIQTEIIITSCLEHNQKNLWKLLSLKISNRKNIYFSFKMDVFEPIVNIDKPFYKYGLIYKYDINNYYLINQNLKKRQKCKCFFTFSFMAFNAIRHSIYILLLKNGRVPNYCFDFTQEMGGLVIYFYIAGVTCSIMSAGFSYYFFNGNKHDLRWIKIIEVLKGIRPISASKIENELIIRKFITHIRHVELSVKITSNILIASVVLMIFVIMIFVYDFWYLIEFGFLSAILYYFYVYYVVVITFTSVKYFYIICYYCKLSMESINISTESLTNKALLSFKSIDKLLKNHNDMCFSVSIYNKFWRNIYRIIIFGLIPFNLIYLHQLLFEEISVQTLVVILFSSILCTIFIFLCNTMTASVSSEFANNYKLMLKLFIKFGTIINMKRKIKVIFDTL